MSPVHALETESITFQGRSGAHPALWRRCWEGFGMEVMEERAEIKESKLLLLFPIPLLPLQ